MRKGRHVYRESDVVACSFPIEHRVAKGTNDPEILAKESQMEMLTADFFGAAFEPSPVVAESCEDERLHKYVQALIETPEFAQLRSRTVLQEQSAELAASSIVQEWFKVVATEEPEKEIDKDIQSLVAASRAARTAVADVQELSDMEAAFGIGTQEGHEQSLRPDEIRRLFTKVRKNPDLRMICELAGRYRRVAQSAQRRKVTHGADDMIGVEMGSDVAKLIPSELAMLADEDFEMDLIRRVFEGAAMQHSYRGIEKVGRGPIVVIVDESGSMNGEPFCNAKAIALAFAWIARHQKRWCCLVGFATANQGSFLTIPPSKENTPKLVEWLVHFFKGGTSLNVPLVEVPKKWVTLGVPEGKTDLILITDGQVNLPEEIRESFLKFKRERSAKLNTILIGQEPGSLKLVSDRIWRADELGVDAAGVAETMGTV